MKKSHSKNKKPNTKTALYLLLLAALNVLVFTSTFLLNYFKLSFDASLSHIAKFIPYIDSDSFITIIIVDFFIILIIGFMSINDIVSLTIKKKLTERKPPFNYSDNSKNFNFEIKEYQGIKHIRADLPFNAPWIFLTGNNGYGKTNILQAITRVLSDSADNSVYNAIKPLSKKTRIKIIFDGQTRTISDHNALSYEKLKYRVMGYGAGRLDMGSDRSSKQYKPAASLFESQVLLRNIEKEGLSRWYFQDNSGMKKFNECVQIFKKILPNLAEIVVDKENSEIWYIEKDEYGNSLPKVKFSDLATGYQNIISMVGDILLNLRMNRKKHEDINLKDNMKAIVLIDELELYLHPKLQKELPGLLTDIFPDVLFIASTHSPIPLLGAPKGSVFYKVDRSSDKGITMTRLDEHMHIDELLPNTLLTSPIFGMDDIFSTNFTGEKPPRTEDNYKELTDNDNLDKQINAFLTNKKQKKLIERYKQGSDS